MSLQRAAEILRDLHTGEVSGEITRVVGLVAESHGLRAPVGAQCEIRTRAGASLACEVVGFRDDSAVVVPQGDIRGVGVGDRIFFRGEVPSIVVSDELIGRTLDSSGQPLELGALAGEAGSRGAAPRAKVPIHGFHQNPLLRRRIREPLTTGVKAIDGLFTVGRGQRMGIFSGSGVGKSVLLGMIARSSDAPVTVIALIGERGREVREFLERDLGDEGRRRAVVVVATGDEPALKRVQAALVATAIAEHFRDAGREVCLLVDSVTRVAMAQREIGLSAGEPPATRGYPPSTFALLGKLLERTGPGEKASITAFYTVLVEADDLHDPIGDTVRSILDGHLWLSRDLASRGHFPAIDPLQSISRVMSDVVAPEHLKSARDMVALVSRYRGVEDLLQMGAYVPGGDPRVDEAVRAWPQVETFLKQGQSERMAFPQTIGRLAEALKPPVRRVAGAAAIGASRGAASTASNGARPVGSAAAGRRS